MAEKVKLADLETYVYIDVSNIRYACATSCGFELDFLRFYAYLRRKYPKLKEVRYYEGIARDDEKKWKHFQFLEKVGYKVCALARKSYVSQAIYGTFACEKCGVENKVQILPATRKMKSNVDVYLAADMIEQAVNREAVNMILVSCDGDYAEAIKTIVRVNPLARVMALATPMTKKHNCLSVRLMELSGELPRESYKLTNMNNIKNAVAGKQRL